MKHSQCDLAVSNVYGHYSVYRIDDSGKWNFLFDKKNTVLYTWGYLAAKLFGEGDSDYKVSAAYIEYENVVNSSDPATIPTVSRDDDISYFTGLAGNKDYLRVALSGTPTIDVSSGYEDYFVGDQGNQCTFVAQTTGSTGVNGLDFSDLVNSKVYGITLVATPLFSDKSQDVLFCRGYFDVADQVLKLAGSNIGIRWKVAFK